MTVIKPVNVLGLLSTSSLEGVYVALLNTDGVDVFDYGRLQHIPYDEALREKIRPLLGTCPYTPEAVAEFQAVNRELTVFHAEIVNYQVKLLKIILQPTALRLMLSAMKALT